MIIPSLRNLTPTTSNEARAKRNNLGEADINPSSPPGRSTSDSSREKLSGTAAHADTVREMAFRQGPSSSCSET